MELIDFIALIHPAIAIFFVFPLIGMVVNFVFSTHQRRLQSKAGNKIKINCVALLLFIGQGMTGTQDLLEIPLSWQEPYIYKCDFVNKTCPTPQPNLAK